MDEKLDRKVKEPSTNLAPDNFLSDLALKEQLTQTINTQKRIESIIEHLKRFKAKIKQEIDRNNTCFKSDLDKCAKENLELLEYYQTSIEKDFKCILSSDDLKEYFHENRDLSSLDLQTKETRLVLENKNKKNSTALNSTIPQIVRLENKIKCLQVFYEELKTEMTGKCEEMINGLDDCYVIYSK